MGIKHAFESEKSDGGDDTLVRPSDWNAEHIIEDYLEIDEASAPSTPASGKVRLYVKTDGRVYSKDDTGTEYGPFDAAGGMPLLYADDNTLHASGDEFDSGMGGWTTGGSPSASSVVSDLYDSSCIDLTFPSQSDRYYKTIDSDFLSGTKSYYLTFHGVTNGETVPSPLNALQAMLSLTVTDNSGNGTGMSLYNDGGAYMWNVAANAYSSTGNDIYPVNVWTATMTPEATGFPVVYRLSKSGTTLTGAISFNGGTTWRSDTRTDSTTFTRVGITRLYFQGGTNPKLRVGRFNLV